MSRNLLSRYIWIIDTIRRHKFITRERLNELWAQSEFASESDTLPRRTFYNYRLAIADLFMINIQCNQSTYEYYIVEEDAQKGSVTDWMLSTASMSSTLTDARDISDRIFLEEVPSAREYLSPIISALKEMRQMEFAYSPFIRSGTSKRVVIEPYFLKIFKQRWYITGRNVREGKIKTYALDRMSEVNIIDNTFAIPDDFNANEYFRHSFGIVFSHGEPKKVTLRVDAEQAKYFRALPLHHSQQEMVDDGSSIFIYYLRLTPDFVQELLSYGPRVTVLGPPELKAMIVENLKQSLNNYEN